MARTARENVRQKILDAAEQRLWRYGFRKTTIDEIAADAGVGKGTVYLYFESKEDISLAIFAGYKTEIFEKQEAIARDPSRGIQEKVQAYLMQPLVSAHDKCEQHPEALEVIVAVKPHIAQRMRPYFEQEVALLATILEDGNRSGMLMVEDTLQAARSLKLMTLSFYPPYPCVPRNQVEREAKALIEMVFRGLRR